jgi:hypothetical protein
MICKTVEEFACFSVTEIEAPALDHTEAGAVDLGMAVDGRCIAHPPGAFDHPMVGVAEMV